MTPPDLLTMDDEPDIPLDAPDDEPEIPLDEPAPAPATEPEALAPAEALARLPLMDVLPADFPIPLLAAFIPNPALRVQADDATRYALSVEVRGAEGLTAADDALTVLRGTQKAITECFAQPVEIANDLHRRLTGIRGDWLKPGVEAIETVGRKVYVETQRLKALADEERRKAQQKADDEARAAARKRVEDAKKAQAPAAVVENLKAQAETVKAAPVMGATSAPPKLAGTSVVKKWTCTLAGTPREAENQQPSVEEMDKAQQVVWLGVLKAIVEHQPGAPPLSVATPNWRSVSARAKSDESTFDIPGFDAYDAGGTRAKGSRSK